MQAAKEPIHTARRPLLHLLDDVRVRARRQRERRSAVPAVLSGRGPAPYPSNDNEKLATRTVVIALLYQTFSSV